MVDGLDEFESIGNVISIELGGMMQRPMFFGYTLGDLEGSFAAQACVLYAIQKRATYSDACDAFRKAKSQLLREIDDRCNAMTMLCQTEPYVVPFWMKDREAVNTFVDRAMILCDRLGLILTFPTKEQAAIEDEVLSRVPQAWRRTDGVGGRPLVDEIEALGNAISVHLGKMLQRPAHFAFTLGDLDGQCMELACVLYAIRNHVFYDEAAGAFSKQYLSLLRAVDDRCNAMTMLYQTEPYVVPTSIQDREAVNLYVERFTTLCDRLGLTLTFPPQQQPSRNDAETDLPNR